VAGFGRVVAEAHLPGFARARGFEIVAVADASSQRREAARAALPEARLYESLADLLGAESRLDFVDIATPPRSHAALVLEALGRSVHVLCEKPLALTRSEIDEIRRGAARAHRAVFCVHNWKYAPLLRRLRGLLAAGTIGEPVEIEWSVLRPDPPAGAVEATWRLDPEQAGGGILVDHGWHAFYLLLFLVGDEPCGISASLHHWRGLAVEDEADLEIDFPNCRARVHLSWNAGERRTRGLVRGANGRIEVGDSSLALIPSRGERQVTQFAPPLSASSYHPEWFAPLLEDFRAEIVHPDRRGRNLTEAAWCVELLAAAYRSKGNWVRFGAPQVPSAALESGRSAEEGSRGVGSSGHLD
jgi:predicted dehydrogenase